MLDPTPEPRVARARHRAVQDGGRRWTAWTIPGLVVLAGVTVAALVLGIGRDQHGSPAAAPSAAPFDSHGLIGGTASLGAMPAGVAGQLSVVAQYPLVDDDSGGSDLPVVIRNNTSASVGDIRITASARDSSNDLVASGQSQRADTDPAVLAPGEVGLTYIQFAAQSPTPPVNAVYAFTVQSDAGTALNAPLVTVGLRVTAASESAGSITGSAQNVGAAAVDGPFEVDLYCLDASSRIVGVHHSTAGDSSTLAPAAGVSFDVDTLGATCPKYLVGVTGAAG